MTTIDTATVSVLLIVLAVAVFASVVTLGFVARSYIATWAASPARRTVAVQHTRFAH
jgi:hypothetical protein